MIESVSGAALVLLSWLITYLLHSSILLSVAALFARYGPGNLSRVKDTVIKFAVVGSLLTATFQTIAPSGPFYLGINVPGTTVVRSDAKTDPDVAMVFPEVKAVGNAGLAHSEGKTADATPGNTIPFAGNQWPALIVMLWSSAGIFFIVRYLLRWIGFLHCLKDRELVGSISLHSMLVDIAERLGIKREIRLTTSSCLSSPVAFGFKEICIPEDFSEKLVQEEQYSALAHEVAHLRRNDPLWLILFGILRNLFTVQPLIRVIYRRYLAESEFICDEMVMQLTGSPGALARSLYKYLYTTNSPAMKQLASTMSGRSGSILERTEKMIRWNGFKPGNGSSIALILIICGVLTLAGWAFPKAIIHASFDNSSSSNSIIASPATNDTDAIHQEERTVSGTIAWVDGKEYQLEMTVSTAGRQNRDDRGMVILDGVIKSDAKMNFHILVEISKRGAGDTEPNVDLQGEGAEACDNPKVNSRLKRVVQSMIALCDVKTFPELSEIKSTLNEGKYLVSVHLSVVINDVYRTTL